MKQPDNDISEAQNLNNQSGSEDKKPDSKEKKDVKKGDDFYRRWEDTQKNKMGNDIAGEIKIANSNGELEGGHDKTWHMDEQEEKKD